VKAVIKELDDWHKKNLSKYKWLRGGFETVTEVLVEEIFFSSFT
jgi:hypothetical protein